MTMLTKAVLIYLCIALAVTFYQPDLVIGDNGKSILQVFNVGLNTTTNQPYLTKEQNFANQDMNTAFDSTQEKTGVFRTFVTNILSGFQIFFDGLWMTISVIKILFNFVFSPILIFTTPEMSEAPLPIVFLFVFPLIFMFVLGILYFIRSGQ